MAEYIERGEAIQAAKHAWAKGIEPSQYIEIIPAADVAPVVHEEWVHNPMSDERVVGLDVPVMHGRWITSSERPDKLICSVCNCGFDTWKYDQHNYCPNCGAKMDLEG